MMKRFTVLLIGKSRSRWKTDYEMYSMDFEEFLWAKGYDSTIAEDMLRHMEELIITKGTFERTLEIQRQLLEDYREDIRKYAEGMDQTRILNVFEQIPMGN